MKDNLEEISYLLRYSVRHPDNGRLMDDAANAIDKFRRILSRLEQPDMVDSVESIILDGCHKLGPHYRCPHVAKEIIQEIARALRESDR